MWSIIVGQNIASWANIKKALKYLAFSYVAKDPRYMDYEIYVVITSNNMIISIRQCLYLKQG